MNWDRAALSAAGFTGWHRLAELRAHLRLVNQLAGGVYLVYRDTLRPPVWLEGEEPAANWVDGANVLYIGTAAHGQLRRRLRAFAEGEAGRHYGGHSIWQLADSAELLVAWRPIRELNLDPDEVAQEMIRRFRTVYGRPPFANVA